MGGGLRRIGVRLYRRGTSSYKYKCNAKSRIIDTTHMSLSLSTSSSENGITHCVNLGTLFIQEKWTRRGQAANKDMPQV
jgi:hypothetical protein